MPATVVIGAQWGDEGKGKIVDYLAKDADIVARFNGGNNAGHTVRFGDQVRKVHLIPSGAFQGEAKVLVITNGMVMDPKVLVEELALLGDNELFIDVGVNLIMPWHKLIDGLEEARRVRQGIEAIGTTRTGNGPVHSDMMARKGLRVHDLWPPARAFKTRFLEVAGEKNRLIEVLGGERIPDVEVYSALDELLSLRSILIGAKRIRFGHASRFLNRKLSEGANVLFEGAHGTLLDITHGDYPYVTSAHCTAGAVWSNAGVRLRDRDTVIGVAKAYSTRVGAGPFPSCMSGGVQDCIREVGGEYGTTTGRPRRIDWLDADILRSSCQINGFDYLAVTKLDTLSAAGGAVIIDQETLHSFEWTADITGCREYLDLPYEVRRFLITLERLAGVRVGIISVGPDREQTIDLRKEW